MTASPTRVAVLGYGVIGRRVADAVAAQPDFVLVGVGIRSVAATTCAGARRGVPLLITDERRRPEIEAAGLTGIGSFDDALARTDVVVDCGQRGTGVERLDGYRAAGVKVAFCGGETSPRTGTIFDPGTDVDLPVNVDVLRLGSCNTIGVARLVQALAPLGIEHVDATFVRATTDPDKATKGPVNDAVVVPGPSHHAHDLMTMFPEVRFTTRAVGVPTWRGHVVSASITTSTRVERQQVLEAVAACPRIVVRAGSDPEPIQEVGAEATLAGRRRGDEHRLVVWRDSLAVDGHRLSSTMYIHMEAITIPDAIDAVRTLAGTSSPASSAALTNSALGLVGPPIDRSANARRATAAR